MLRRPFLTPLSEVSAQLDLDVRSLVEFRAQSVYNALSKTYPNVQRLPVFLVTEADSVPNVFTPGYRFYSEDGKRIVQIGPRMISLNTVNWEPGFENYRDALVEVFNTFNDIMGETRIQRYSLGFYNRLPVSDLDEIREIINVPIELGKDAQFEGLGWQTVRSAKVGDIATQVSLRDPDERTPEPHLGVNNIIQHTLDEPRPLRDEIDNWRAWIDAANAEARENFWNLLSPAAQKSWKQGTSE